MRKRFTFLFIAVAGLICCERVTAQELSARAAAEAFLRPELSERIVLADTLLDFDTVLRSNARIDVGEGIVRAEYRIEARHVPSLDADEAALLYLEQSAAKFGITAPRDELLLTHVRRGHRSTHIRFRQTYRDIPVYNREVKVNLDAEGRPTMVVNGFAPHISRDVHLRTTPGISQNDAAARAASAGRAELATTTPELVVYPSTPARLAWMLIAWPQNGAAEWEVLVDAHSGEIIQMLDLSPHAHHPAPSIRHEGVAARSRPLPAGPAAIPAIAANVDGTGLVFDPDPITSAGVAYGGAYVDAQDSDVPELNAERRQVPLRDISQGADGLFRLIGPYVAIDGATRGDAYSPPAEASPDGFQYTRSNDYFEAVMAYYHIDTSQRYLQSLDVGFDIMNEPMLVNPHAYRIDYSQFSPSNNILMFGIGGIDDAEDADVILHEYAHALLYSIEPGLLRTSEGKALHEGWGDYWAASYSRFLSEEDPSIPPNDWWRVFTWDGNVPCWLGRPLDHPGRYPDDTSYPTSGCISYLPQYHSGLLWATTLMEIYPEVGRTVLDRLNLASHAFLASSATLPDAAQAIIQADRDLYGGAHVDILVERFGERGFVDPSKTDPNVATDGDSELPSAFALHQNYPNPFNPTTQITFDVPTSAHVTITVVDLLGRVIYTLVDGEKTPGTHGVALDMTSRPSGVYFYSMQAGEFSRVQRLILAK